MLNTLTKIWFGKNFTETARAEWNFIQLFKENRNSYSVFVQSIHEYLQKLLIYEIDIYTEDRIRVAARVIEKCNISDSTIVPVLIQLLEQLANYGTHRKPVDNLVSGLRACWDNKYRSFLDRVVERYPKLMPIDI